MNTRRWLALVFGLLVVGGAVGLYALPEVVRRVAVARIQASTQRPASIDRVDLNVFTGRLTVHGLRVAERDGRTPFTVVGRLHVQVRLASLLRGHLRFSEITVADSTVRVVRLSPETFNFSDLVGRSESTGGTIDVTVDRFAVSGGKVTLEDRALAEPRTWTSEHIEIDARDLSTRAGGGRAVARSVTAGAPVAMELEDVRLHPIHLRARVTTEGLDLSLARLYLPAEDVRGVRRVVNTLEIGATSQ